MRRTPQTSPQIGQEAILGPRAFDQDSSSLDRVGSHGEEVMTTRLRMTDNGREQLCLMRDTLLL